MQDSTILIRNIFHMLCYAFHVLRQRNYADIEAEDFRHVQDMLAAILARGIAQQLKQGLYRTYVTYNDAIKTVRGKINLLETKRLRTQRIPRIDCDYDELSEDNTLNQILRATALTLIRSTEVGISRKDALKREILYFNNVSDIDLATVQWGRLQIHRNNRTYEMLMSICQMAWMSLLPSTSSGDKHFSLFDEESMPRLYEKFILQYYRQHYPMLHPNDDAIKWDIAMDADPHMIRMLPGMHSDIVLRYGDRKLIIDAKYYQSSVVNYMGKQMLHNANLYQIYTYVKNEDKAHTGKVSGLLLYARTTEDVPPLMDAVIGGNRISAKALDLNKSFSEISGTLDLIVGEAFDGACIRIA